MPRQKFITPKFQGSINAYTANEDGSLDVHLEAEKPCPPLTDKHGNFFIRIPAGDVDRFMYAGIDALKQEPSTR